MDSIQTANQYLDLPLFGGKDVSVQESVDDLPKQNLEGCMEEVPTNFRNLLRTYNDNYFFGVWCEYFGIDKGIYKDRKNVLRNILNVIGNYHDFLSDGKLKTGGYMDLMKKVAESDCEKIVNSKVSYSESNYERKEVEDGLREGLENFIGKVVGTFATMYDDYCEVNDLYCNIGNL